MTQTQYEQVLDNLAMSCVDPSVLPSLVSIRTGSTQIGDTGTLGFAGTAGLQTPFGSSPTISASRSIVDQWGNAPIADDNELKVLRKAFRTARGFSDLIRDADEANNLGTDLCQQIGTNSDISVEDSIYQKHYDILAKEVLDDYHDFLIKAKLTPDFDEPIQNSFLNKQITDLNDFSFSCSTLRGDFIENHPTKPNRFAVRGQSANPDIPSLPSTGLAKEAVRRINDVQETLEGVRDLGTNWYHMGCKRDVPKDAYYVGRARRPSKSCRHWTCDADCYVWVCGDGLPALSEFTLSIIKLSGTFKDVQIVASPSGVQYSPTFSR